MANQKLIYNLDGIIAETSSSDGSGAYYDTTQGSLVVKNLVINKITASLSAGILATDANGKLTNIPTSSAAAGTYLQSNGSSWVLASANTSIAGDYTADSDLTGAYASPQVINISNVTSGTLSSSYGGTGVSSFVSGGIVVKDDTGKLKFVVPDAGFSVLRPSGSTWFSGGASGSYTDASVSYFTCSAVGVSTAFSWTKPTGHENIRLVLVAGGGGGGGGGGAAASNGGGGGGSSGGVFLNDMIIKSSLTITGSVGNGGSGGVCGTTTGSPGIFGSPTYVSGTNYPLYIFARGGNAGGGSTNPSPGAGGVQVTSQIFEKFVPGGGGGVGQKYTPGTAVGAGSPHAYFSGGGSGGAVPSAPPGNAPGGAAHSSLLLSPTSGRGGTTNHPGTAVRTPAGVVTLASLGSSNIRFSGGGSGGSNVTLNALTNGENGLYGSGGGGGAWNAPSAYRGGNGGDGYAVIISW